MNYRAWQIKRPNGPFEQPALKAKQALVKISASGVSPLDTKIRSGNAAHAQQNLPAVLGVEMAGIVEDVGPGVTAFKVRDEVYGLVGGVGGMQGTLAEYVITDTDLLARKPRRLSIRQSAVLPLAVITAWEGLVDRA